MRSWIIAIILIGTSSIAAAYDFSLVPYRQGTKWGYCDRQKHVIIAPQFTEVNFFSGGPLAKVEIDSYSYVINRRGERIWHSRNFIQIINDGYNFIGHEGFYECRIYDTSGKPVTKVYTGITGFDDHGYATIKAKYVKEGLLDRSFREVIPPVYSNIDVFSKDLVMVHKDSLGSSLVNVRTGWHMDAWYDRIFPPHEGLMMVRKGDYYGFIDEKGKVVIPIEYARVCPDGNPLCFGHEYNEGEYVDFHLDGFYDGLAVVVSGETVFYINKKGKRMYHIKMTYGYGFQNGLAWVNKDDSWGIVNRNGKFIIEPHYAAPTFCYAKELTALASFREGMLAVNDKTSYGFSYAADSIINDQNKYGYVDEDGHVAIPYRYISAAPFYNGLAAVQDSTGYGVINKKGETVIPLKYKWIEGAGIYATDPFAAGAAAAQEQDGTWVIINKKGEQLLPCHFDKDNRIEFGEGIADASANGKRYVFDSTGKIIYTFATAGSVTKFSRDIYYCHDEKCYIDIRQGIKYCE